MTPLFIGFFTIDTPYQYEVVECIETLDRFGLAHQFIGVEPRGSWARNCALKPSAILSLMDQHPGETLVYLDTDSRVRRRPELFDRITTDLAVHYRDGHELLSSVIYLGPGARPAIEAWDRECRAFIESGSREHCLFEQLALQRVLERGIVSVFRLPPEYARVFDDSRMGEPVIEQMQASRRHAAKVLGHLPIG